MKIRGKLITAFLIIILIPVILLTVVLGMIISMQVSALGTAKEDGTIQTDMVVSLSNPVQILNRNTKEIFDEIKNTATEDPNRFLEADYVRSVNEKLQKKYSFLVVRKDNSFVYEGDDELSDSIKERFPAYGMYLGDVEAGLYIGGEEPFLIKQHDFHFQDGSQGSVFIVTEIFNIFPKIRMLLIECLIAFIMIICFTASILTWWIYNGMVKPLNVLRTATHRMRDGDLNFSIEVNSDDEIGMLCSDFEEMRKRLKDQIEARLGYEIEMRELISNISHDLKTPLTAIEGYTEGIMDGVADTPEKMEKYLKTIYQKAKAMTGLVDELSFYSKIDNNTMPYTFVNLNLEQYFSDCISEIILDLEVKNIELGYFNYMDQSLMVQVDAEQLKRVINNIVGNAVKYMDKKKGLINIRISDDGEFVKVQFEDNGKGIPEEDVPYIFDRFYRADSSRNSSTGGSGLGLAISKKIIEALGGHIWAESKEGVGTSICFTLKKSKDCFEEMKKRREAEALVALEKENEIGLKNFFTKNKYAKNNYVKNNYKTVEEYKEKQEKRADKK